MNSIDHYLNRSTRELIQIFEKKGSPESDLAFTALVYRFREDLLKKCEIICYRFGHSYHVAEEVAENTFAAFLTKGRFISGNVNAKSIDDEFLFYLYGIASRELTNYYRKQQKIANGQYYDGTEKIITELPYFEKENLRGEALVRYNVVQSFPYPQRVIYLTYEAYEKIGCNLPRKLQTELRTHLNDIKQSTVRSYKKEANDKIEDAIKIFNLSKQL